MHFISIKDLKGYSPGERIAALSLDLFLGNLLLDVLLRLFYVSFPVSVVDERNAADLLAARPVQMFRALFQLCKACRQPISFILCKKRTLNFF
jgi:hypothetical protein